MPQAGTAQRSSPTGNRRQKLIGATPRERQTSGDSDILAKLGELSVAGAPYMHKASLESLATAVAAALDAESCAILLSDPLEQTLDGPPVGPQDVEMAIRTGNRQHGTIRLQGLTRKLSNDEIERLRLIACCLALKLESIGLHCVVRSRFAQLTIAQRRSLKEVITVSAQHPDKTARLLARTFYRELAGAGFSANSITNAASEIVSQLAIHLQQRKHQPERAHGEVAGSCNDGTGNCLEESTMDGTLVVMFPGLEARYPQMLARYLDAYPDDRSILADWPEIPTEAVPSQPAEQERARHLETHALNLLWWRRTSADLSRPAICGHGFGYYAALVASGVIDEEDSFRLINEAFSVAWRHVGVNDEDKLMFTVTTRKDYPFDEVLTATGVEVLSETCSRQRVMYGTHEQFEKVRERANGSLLAATPLAIRVPFHSIEMQWLRDELAERIERLELRLRDPKLPLWSHLDGRRIYKAADALRVVVDQSYQRVQWMLLVERLIQAGRFDYIEVGPNRLLSQTVRLICPYLSVRFVDRLRGRARSVRVERSQDEASTRVQPRSYGRLHRFGYLSNHATAS